MTRAVLFGVAGVVVVGTAGFLAGRLSTVDTSLVQLTEPHLREKAAGLKGWSAGPRKELTAAEWKTQFGSDVGLAARRIMGELNASTVPDFDFESMYAAYQFSRQLSVKQIQEALAEVENEDNPGVAMAMRNILVRQWAGQEGEAAMEYVLGRRGFERNSLVHAALAGWLRVDPVEAHKWFEANEHKIGGNRFVRGRLEGMVYGALAQRDLPGTLERIHEGEVEARGQALGAISGAVFHDDLKRARFLAAVEDFGDEAFTDLAVRELVNRWTWHDPRAAAEFLAGAEISESTRGSLEERLYSSWSQRDPKGALEWNLGRVDAVADKQVVLAQHFGGWLAEDERAASEWLANQPEDLQSDAIFRAAAHSLIAEKPRRAAEWAEQIIADEMREQVLADVYVEWFLVDEQAAASWLTTLNEDEQAGIVARVEDAGVAGDPGAAMVEALESELQGLEEAMGISPAELAAKREQLEELLDEFGDPEGTPVSTEQE